MAKLFVPRRFIQMSPQVGGAENRRSVHFHFRPVRPANLGVTLDPLSGEVNVYAGTYGPLSDDPLAIVLHIHRDSFDTLRNVTTHGVGGEIVVALPGRDLVDQTWHAALPLPRGISEAEVARLTTVPSTLVAPPSIADCPVNLECVVDAIHPYGIHHLVFCRVLGASVDEAVLGQPRADLIRRFPTFECDDAVNEFGGAIERLSVLGDLLPAPEFPAAPRAGLAGSLDGWLGELAEAGFISERSAIRVRELAARWEGIAESPEAPGRLALRERLSRAIELLAWGEFAELEAFAVGEEGRA